ncbi:MAG: DUF4386 domain-containing protein [Gammaproteobacteria bacterium]|nr:DUF4386 domain-containing protein [Gammaproteobacteria bacterium]
MTSSELKTGRIVAALILIQMALGPFLNFGLLEPVFAQPGFLQNAAGHSTEMGIAALLGIALGAVSLGIAITAWPVFSRHSQRFALWVLALSTVGLALATVESATVLSLRSLSENYANTPGADIALFTALRGIAAAARNWAHYTHLIVAGLLLLSFYGLLCRFALVPRVLAAFGVFAALCQLTAVSMPLFGQPIIFALLSPLGLSHLVLAIWLLAKGFRDTTPTHLG